jgi:hypothetical protein
MTDMIGQMGRHWGFANLRLLIASGAVYGALVLSASAEPIKPDQVAVIDGDTIRIDLT